jgi:hypothetical protein
MRTHATAVALVLTGLAFMAGARADEWEFGTDTDNGAATDNALAHGAVQLHDLVGFPQPDQDWYRVPVDPLSSFQFVLDGMTGDLDLVGSSLQRIGADAVTVQGSAVVEGDGGILSLDWITGETAPAANFVRVQGANCSSLCDALDRYRARFLETTYTVPRFNNTGTQATVLLVQNASARTCPVVTFLLAADGSVSGGAPAVLTPGQVLVFNLATSAPGQSGSIRITHGCGYGGLAGKAVAIEPATGFTFDTPLVPRPF